MWRKKRYSKHVIIHRLFHQNMKYDIYIRYTEIYSAAHTSWTLLSPVLWRDLLRLGTIYFRRKNNQRHQTASHCDHTHVLPPPIHPCSPPPTLQPSISWPYVAVYHAVDACHVPPGVCSWCGVCRYTMRGVAPTGYRSGKQANNART